MYRNESTVDFAIAADQMIKEKEYWLNKLQGELVKTYFPYDFPPEKHAQGEKGQLNFRFSKEIDSRLLSIANNSEIRLFMLLAAGMTVLLHKYTGNKDIMIGVPILKQELHGDFINTMLILRNYLDDHITFKELLYISKQTLVEAVENQNYPIKLLIQELGLETLGQEDGNPFSDCIILLEGIHDRNYIQELNPAILFSFSVEQETIPGRIEYNAACYHESTIKRISRHLQYLFQHVLDHLDSPLEEISILSADEKKQLLVEFNSNNSGISTGFNTIVDWFENQVEKTPGLIAVEYEDQKIDYMELNKRANQLARILIKNGAHQDTITSLMLRSSLEMIIAILAVLKTGGAYLPIDPGLPETRIKYIIEDSSSKYLLISKNLLEKSPFSLEKFFKRNIFVVDNDKDSIYNDEDTSNTGIHCESNALAYLIYTSGSTGLPKGVLIEHKGILNYINWRYHTYQYSEQDITLQLLSYSFDGFMSNLYSSLLSGGILLIIPDMKMLDFHYIIGLIKKKRVTNTSIIPDVFNMILEYAQREHLKSFRFVVLAGEKAKDNLVKKIKNINADIMMVNEYGPTEASVTAAANINMDKSPTSIIGKPIANTKILILNSTLKMVPVGVTGELCIAGQGLARGYLNNPEFTRDRFVENPFERGTAIYRTGDSALWLPDGNIEFKGRMDFQVKIRGFRIELEEIKQKLLNHKDIKDVVVTARVNSDGERYICAYIVSEGNLQVTDLKRFLNAALPPYMLPDYFVQLDKIPLTNNGKVDRKALPEPEKNVSIDEYTPPGNEIEDKLTGIWSEILGIEKENIGIKNNFFEIGGHSLNLVQLVSTVHKEFNTEIPIIHIFQNPTIKEIAKHIQTTTYAEQPVILLNKSKQGKIFCFPPGLGFGISYYPLSLVIKDYSFYSFNFIEEEDRIEKYVNLMTEFQPDGPYILLGWSAAGRLIFQVTKALENIGREVSDIIFNDCFWTKNRKIESNYEINTAALFKYIEEILDESGLHHLRKKVRQKSVAYRKYLLNVNSLERINANVHLILSHTTQNKKTLDPGCWDELTAATSKRYKGTGIHNEMLFPGALEKNARIIMGILNDINSKIGS